MTVQPFTPAEMALSQDAELPLGVRNIVAWAGTLNAAASLVTTFVDTPFMPASFWPLPHGMALRDFPGSNPALKHPRETPEEYQWRRQGAIAAGSGAVLFGGSLGLDPLVSFTSVYVFRGKPGLYAEAMEALVKSKGHDIVLEELTDSRCVIRGRRKGREDWERFTFTMDRARKAGYTKQNPKYDTDPQSMLHARCRAIASRGVAPDVLKGIASVEEITDEVSLEVQPARTRTVKRADSVIHAIGRTAAATETGTSALMTTVAEQPAGQPSGPPLPGDDNLAEPMLDARQWDAINRRFVELEVVGDGQKAARLTVISAIVRRTIVRGGELTAAEGQLVLDKLAGNDGFEVVGAALGREASAAEPVTDDPEQDDTADEAEPTDQEWDAMGGAEAEAESSRG